MKRCERCAFPLGVRPGNIDSKTLCGACINHEKADSFDWAKREQDLVTITNGLKMQYRQSGDGSANSPYSCAVAVSGGKDSTVIVARLVEKYGLRPLLITVTDEFTHTKAGSHNAENIARRFNLDHIVWRCEPMTFREETKADFLSEMHPLKWIEERLYGAPIMLAKALGIPAIFFGENSGFQYGTNPELEYEHRLSSDALKVYYFFAFERYSELGNRAEAKKYGFIDLDDTGEWFRQGHIENYTQQDSVAYVIQLWTKFIKYGFQRVSDIACRYVRSGELTREQALSYIYERDWRCDPFAKRDFCNTIGITEEEFDKAVDKHANKDIVAKDANGQWKLKEVLQK